MLMSFALTNNARNVHSCAEKLEMLHELFFLIFGIKDCQLRENSSCVAAHLNSKTRFHHGDELLEVAPSFIYLNQLLNLVWNVHQVKAAHLSQPELLSVNTSNKHFLPGPRKVSLASSFNCISVLLKTNKAGRQFVVLRNAREEHTGSLEATFVGTPLTNLLNVREVGRGDKLLQLAHQALLSKRHQHCSVNNGPRLLCTKILLTSHLKEADEMLIVTRILCCTDNL
mmetsp:Transcript_5533/g.12293  ORF Transcript_5533/g.12293 Transcript_5533/m.12293 type:complete len:227 (-) Transcript_5533:2473-3153(-)